MVIGLCGPEGAGKSTVAKILAEKYGAAICPFAAPLKKMGEAIGIPHRNLYGNDADKNEPLHILGGKTARRALQTLGTQWGRMCMDADFWVRAWANGLADAWADRARRGVAQPEMIVADDCRFPNEVEEIRRRGGLVLTIVRDMSDFNRVPQHASEDFAALRADAVIVNDGSLAELDAGVREALALKRDQDSRQTALSL
jgi:hypothetical protein